jgi:hypothetical protein
MSAVPALESEDPKSLIITEFAFVCEQLANKAQAKGPANHATRKRPGRLEAREGPHAARIGAWVGWRIREAGLTSLRDTSFSYIVL